MYIFVLLDQTNESIRNKIHISIENDIEDGKTYISFRHDPNNLNIGFF
jgi:hypothetical protein